MQKVVLAGYNTKTKKMTPWQPHLEKIPHIVKVQAKYDTETRKFTVIRKLDKDKDDEIVSAEITAADIKKDLRDQEERRQAKAAEEAALLALEDAGSTVTAEDIQRELDLDADKLADAKKVNATPEIENPSRLLKPVNL